MKFQFYHLSQDTSSLMRSEAESDRRLNGLYRSKRSNQNELRSYATLLALHLTEGNDCSLAEDLKRQQCYKTHEKRMSRGKITLVKVPVTVADTFAQGEFNRFYIRALCLQAIENGKPLIIYRARSSENPRFDADYVIGAEVDAFNLLGDLHNNTGTDTSFGLPAGPNSGLSVKFGDAGFSFYQ